MNFINIQTFYATFNHLINLLSTEEPTTAEKATTNDATITAVKAAHDDGKTSMHNYNGRFCGSQ